MPPGRWPGFSKAPLQSRAARGMDYHLHLLPGVDDGVTDFGEARLAIAGLRALGFSGAVLTPHVYAGVFDNERDGLRRHFQRFVTSLAAVDEKFQLHLAAEYFADAAFLRLIEDDDILFAPVDGERWVLVEFPALQEVPVAGAAMAALVAHGYRPVIAHVERYRYVAGAPDEWLARFAAAGALLQADIGSLAGQHGAVVQRFARRLAAQGKVDIWGTDLHRIGQLQRYIVPGLAWLDAIGHRAALGLLSAEAAE